MTTRKGMKVILFGAAVLLIAGITVSADEIEERIPEIETTSVENPDDLIIAPNPATIEHDALKGERGDIENEPGSEEDLIIAPYDQEELIISPNPDANNETFILDSGSEMTDDSEMKITTASFGIPVLIACAFIGLIGGIYIYKKKQE